MLERWKAVPGYEGYYEASTTGIIRSVDRIITMKSRVGKPTTKKVKGKILKLSPMWKSTDYLVVSFSRGKSSQKLVHRVILETFVGPCPDGMEARHLNGNRQDNRKSNLAWGTPIENASDRDLHGKTAKGWKHACSLTATEKRQAIMDLYLRCGYSVELLARVFGRPELTIRYLIGTYKGDFHKSR